MLEGREPPLRSSAVHLALAAAATLGAAALPGSECALPGGGFRFLGPARLDLPGAEAAAGVDLADLDGDRLPDAVASIGGAEPRLRVYLAQKPLCWTEAQDFPAPFAGDVELLDVTGDVRLDALVFRGGSDSSLA